MMLVPVRLDRGSIHGLGLLSEETIPAGTPVRRSEPCFDRVFAGDELAGLPTAAQRHLRHFGYFDSSRESWVLNGDLAILLNHAAEPNIGAPGVANAAPSTIALRDIAAGKN